MPNSNAAIISMFLLMTTSSILSYRRTALHVVCSTIKRNRKTATHSVEQNSKFELKAPPGIFSSYAALVLVPIVWGTYTPIVKDLYTVVEIPPPSLIFNFMSYIVSFAALSIAYGSSNLYSDMRRPSDVPRICSQELANPILTSKITPKERSPESIPPYRLVRAAGFELGGWLFLGSTCQVIGIQSTTAIKASILVQLTTVIVPVLESFIGNSARSSTGSRVSPKLWASSLLAFCGVALISSAGDGVTSNFGHVSSGDGFVVLSSVFYSMHVVRLGKYALEIGPVQLARAKAATELILSTAAIAGSIWLMHDDEILRYMSTLMFSPWDGAAVGGRQLLQTVIWNGAFVTALTMWCQSYGQNKVPPTEANLIYTSQPLWSILISYFALHEAVDPTIAPGVIVLISSIVLSLSAQSHSADMKQA